MNVILICLLIVAAAYVFQELVVKMMGAPAFLGVLAWVGACVGVLYKLVPLLTTGFTL